MQTNTIKNSNVPTVISCHVASVLMGVNRKENRGMSDAQLARLTRRMMREMDPNTMVAIFCESVRA